MCKSKLLKSALKEGGSIADQAANLVPKIENYGIVLLKNMHESDLESCKSIGEPLISNKSRLFGFYIIPQYMISLDGLINQREERNITMSPKQILDIGIQLLNSLQILHSVGYTHNDIKPANIMLNNVSDDDD